jgi:uncharacterized protein (DUF2342 family)
LENATGALQHDLAARIQEERAGLGATHQGLRPRDVGDEVLVEDREPADRLAPGGAALHRPALALRQRLEALARLASEAIIAIVRSVRPVAEPAERPMTAIGAFAGAEEADAADLDSLIQTRLVEQTPRRHEGAGAWEPRVP